MRSWHLAAVICGFTSLLLLLIALGTDYWVDVNGTYGGLWKVCLNYSMRITCFYTGIDVGGYIHATRMFMILGMLAGFISCALLSVLLCRSEIGSYSVRRAASFSSYVAGVCALIAMAVFTGMGGLNRLYRWSFGLGWACSPLFLVTGGLARKLQTYAQFAWSDIESVRRRHRRYVNLDPTPAPEGRIVRSNEWT